MDRLSTEAAATDGAFRQALTGDFTGFDRMVAEAVALRNSPAGLWDRLHDKLASLHANLDVDRQILAQRTAYVSGEYRESVRRRYELRRAAHKCLRRRIDRLVRKGKL